MNSVFCRIIYFTPSNFNKLEKKKRSIRVLFYYYFCVCFKLIVNISVVAIGDCFNYSQIYFFKKKLLYPPQQFYFVNFMNYSNE